MPETRADIEEMINILTHPENHDADEIETNKMNIVESLREKNQLRQDHDTLKEALQDFYLEGHTCLQYMGQGRIGDARESISNAIERTDHNPDLPELVPLEISTEDSEKALAHFNEVRTRETDNHPDEED